MAGESAGSSARRMRERAERLHRAADMWERGAEGERRTAEALAALPAHEWTVFHDVPWPGRPRANVDHVAVGPTGIFVIDSKHWSGSITVRDDILRQNGYRRDRVISGAVEAASAIAALVPAVRRGDVHPVICFVRDDPFAALVGGVVLTSTAQLVRALQHLPVVFVPEGRQAIAWELELGLPRGGPRPTAISRPRAAPPPVPKRSRPQSSHGLVSSIIGGVLAVGVLGVAFTQRDEFAEAFVSRVGGGTDQPPADKPVEKRKDGERQKDRQDK